MLAAHPEIASGDIHVAAALGDDAAVRRFLAADPANATAKSGPRDVDALTYLCFSRYLALDPTRSPGFVRAATALLDAGASVMAGFFDETHRPRPEWESVLYGAAGVAHHSGVTRVLLDRGADPNDEETPYHSPETHDNTVVKMLVETGKLTPANLSMMLIRKHDWHDEEGVQYLLEHGADPNYERTRGWIAIHHALARNNSLAIIDLLLDHGADPRRTKDGLTVVARAARRGRGDVLASLVRRGIALELDGVDRLLAACAMDDGDSVRSVAAREPQLVRQLVAQGGTWLAQFASTGNTAGVGHLLDRGVPVGALYKEGDGYFDITPGSTALHVAAWRAYHETVKLLIARGAPIAARDGKGRTALMLAVKACVDSYWMVRRSPESVQALLGAGASRSGVTIPSGYAAVDELLQ